jgi:glutaredoxin
MLFLIYGTPSCKFCDKAKTMLSDLNLSYTYVNLEETYGSTWHHVLTDLRQIIGGTHRSIPLVFRKDSSTTIDIIPPPDTKNLDTFADWTFVGDYFRLEDYVENEMPANIDQNY